MIRNEYYRVPSKVTWKYAYRPFTLIKTVLFVKSYQGIEDSQPIQIAPELFYHKVLNLQIVDLKVLDYTIPEKDPCSKNLIRKVIESLPQTRISYSYIFTDIIYFKL